MTTPIGNKRLTLDTNYIETFNRDIVSMIDVPIDPIQTLAESGLKTGNASYARAPA